MKLVLGSMTFGDQTGHDDAAAMLQRFAAAGQREVDTAYAYSEGRSETLLAGLLPPAREADHPIATKVNPWNEHGLQPDAIEQQFSRSLDRLGRERVDLLYLHSPDVNTPIRDTLARVFDWYRAGRFRRFGLSNYAAWQVAEIVEICRAEGWMLPSVYQGMYNALTRDVERELFSCLRHFGIAFYAYNPLAGGLLSGKHRSAQAPPESGRFALRTNYRERYWKTEYLEVIDELIPACEAAGRTPTEAAFAWLVHHSMLDAARDDAIILGASKIDHLDANLQACSDATPLPADILDLFDRGWARVEPGCFRYFRF